MEDVELYSSAIEYEINQICSILEDNKIPFIRKDYGSGSYMNLYYGHSIQEKKIFVHRKDYEKAMEIVANLSSTISNTDAQQIEQNIEEDDYDNYKKYKSIKNLFKIYIIAMPLIAIILGVIAYILHY